MRDPQGKSKILHSQSYAYFPVITSPQDPSVPTQMGSSNVDTSSVTPPLPTSAFLRKPSPQPSTPGLSASCICIYLFQSFIHSIVYII